MKVPVSWLKDYVDLTVSVEELAYRLTLAGLEVDRIRYIGIPPGDIEPDKAVDMVVDTIVWDRDSLVLGYIHEVKPHPDADRLVLAMVDYGGDALEQAVTGAPNLFQYVGAPLDEPLAVVFALEGAELLDPYSDEWPNATMTLKPRELRGIENRSMVCSEKEIGLSEFHDGILILDTDLPAGTPIQDVLGDAVIEFELTPNFARAFSMMGIAREVAAVTGAELRHPPTQVKAEGEPIEGQVGLDIREPELNPRFTLALLKGVTVEPSPKWMQRRLLLAGMRPVNNIVDITNYVMLETGQPLHAFDYDILVERADGQTPTIITRLPEPGESLVTLDDVERTLDEFTILVADEAGVLSLGGIMGGDESEIHAGTQTVLLEAAGWNYINIRKTLSAQRERGKPVSSEAGARFSRGVHPAQAKIGLLRAIEIMRQIAGGTIAQGILDDYPAPPEPIVVDLPMSEVERILGIAVPVEDVRRILESLEFGVEKLDDSTLRVTVPEHRMDIQQIHVPGNEDIGDVVAQADLIEEIARIYGYDAIPNTMLIDELPPQRNNPTLQAHETVRDVLVEAGLVEIITYRFTTPEREALLTPLGSPSDLPNGDYVRLANPLSADKAVLRHSLIGPMLETLALNNRWRVQQRLFELGKVYLPAKDSALPQEPWRLCLGLMGSRSSSSWLGAEDGLMDFYDMKGVVEALMRGLHINAVHYEPAEHATFFPGRVARVMAAEEAIGVFGQIHPMVVQAHELPDIPVLVADLDMDALMYAMRPDFPVEPLSAFPAVYEDIAVIVDKEVAAARVEMVIRSAGGFLLKDVQLFDVYEGDPVPEGKKSLAYALSYQAPDKTLRDKDITKLRKRIVSTLKDELDAVLRE